MKKIYLLIITILFFSVCISFRSIEAVSMQWKEVTVGQKNFNGYNITRNTGYTVIYNNNPGGPSGANTWGYEAAVDKDGYVVEIAGNVTTPEGGYVISTVAEVDFVANTMDIGDTVTVDKTNKTFTVKRNIGPQQIFKLNLLFNRYKEYAFNRIDQLYDVDQATIYKMIEEIPGDIEKLEEMKQELDQMTSVTYVKVYGYNIQATKILNKIQNLYYASMETIAVAGRTLWHRPFSSAIDETTTKGVIQFVDKIASMGFNGIYIETIWGGMTSYPSSIVPQHTAFSNVDYGSYGKDYIALLIEECHKRGIEVYAWCEVFGIGQSNIANLPDDWFVYDGNFTRSEYFLDPTRPEVKDHLINLYKEVVEKYDFDGLEYDYVRYQYSTQKNDHGYSSNALKGFAENEGLDYTTLQDSGVAKKIQSDTNLYTKWTNYKSNALTDVVRDLSKAIKSVRKNLTIAGSVWYDAQEAKKSYCCDWGVWAKEGFIDVLNPMIYASSEVFVANTAAKIEAVYGKLFYQYAGIDPLYDGYNMLENQKQVEAIQEKNTVSGIAMFCAWNYINGIELQTNENQNALSLSSQRYIGATPESTPGKVLYYMTQEFKHKIKDIYIPKTQEAVLTDMYDMFDQISKMPYSNPKDWNDIINALKEIKDYTIFITNKDLSNRLSNSIDYYVRIFETKINRYLINYGYWDPKTQDKPDVNTLSYDAFLSTVFDLEYAYETNADLLSTEVIDHYMEQYNRLSEDIKTELGNGYQKKYQELSTQKEISSIQEEIDSILSFKDTKVTYEKAQELLNRIVEIQEKVEENPNYSFQNLEELQSFQGDLKNVKAPSKANSGCGCKQNTTIVLFDSLYGILLLFGTVVIIKKKFKN